MKVNGTLTDNIIRINGVPIDNIYKFNGIELSIIPPPTASFVTSSLIAYWDPDVASSRGPLTLSTGVVVSASFDLTYLYTASNAAYTRSLTLRNGADFIDFTSGGLNTKVVYLDGVNDYAVATSSIANTGDPFRINELLNYTTEIWVRSSGSWINSGNWWSAAFNTGTRIRANNTTGSVWYYAQGIAESVTGGSISINTWNHVVLTMANVGANDRMTLYVNGTQSHQDTVGNYTPSQASGHFYVGGRQENAELQRMYYGIIRRYNKELTLAEIQQNFDAEKSRYGY